MTPEHQQLIQRIRASAAAVQQAVAALPPARQAAPAQSGEWSARQVLLHTRDVAMLAYGLRIRRLLYETNPSFTPYEEDAYRAANPGDSDSIDDIVHMLAAEHDLVAHILTALPDAAWQYSGRGPDGTVRSIEYFAQRFVAHAEEHATQLAALGAAAAR